MGKGNYRGDTHEIVMFFTTKDGGFDVDLTPFVKDTIETYDPDLNRTVLHWTSNVTFKEYSFQLKTTHFNINVLAEKIKNHLIDIKHPEFSYKIPDSYHKLGKRFFDETHFRFGYALNNKLTTYNPVKDEYQYYYNLDGETIVYSFIGDSYYIPDSFLNFVLSHAKKNEYEVTFGYNRIAPAINRLVENLSTNKIKAGRGYYKIDTDNFYQVVIVSDTKIEKYITNSLMYLDKEDLKDFLKDRLPEYMI